MATWADNQIRGADCHGTLTLDGRSMNRAAWAVLNNWVFWQPAAKRGEDNIIPGRSGALPNRRRRTATVVTLELLIIGTVDRLGVAQPPADWQQQLALNSEWLDDNIFAPVNTTDGTRTAVLTLPSGYTRTGPVHVLDVNYGVTVAPAITATVDISIPAGQLGPLTAP